MKEILEGWRSYQKQLLKERSKFSKNLKDLVVGDQKLRNAFADEMNSPIMSSDKFTPKPQGWSEELVDQFTKKHGTTRGDVFGSKAVEENFAKLFPQLDFSSFDDKDWENFQTLILHQRKPEYLQMRKTSLSKMIEYKRWWRDLATDMARSAGLLPEFENVTLSYPEDTKDGGKVDLLLKKKKMTWGQLVNKLGVKI